MPLVVLRLLGGPSACEVRPRCFLLVSWLFFFLFQARPGYYYENTQKQFRLPKKPQFVSELTLAYVGTSDRRSLVRNEWLFF